MGQYLDLLPITLKRRHDQYPGQASSARQKEAKYEVQLGFYTHIPFQTKINICKDKLLPLFYIPDVRITDVTYDDFTLKGMTMNLHVAVENKNDFPFKVRDVSYEFEMADHPVMKGTKGGILDIREKGTTHFILPLKISFGGIFDSIGKLITKGGKTDYNFTASFKVVADKNTIKNSKMVIHDQGSIKEIKQFMREAKEKAKDN